MPQPPRQLLYPVTRCQVCGWVLATDSSKGCVPGNCSMRPDEGTEEHLQLRSRRAWLEANHPDILSGKRIPA